MSRLLGVFGLALVVGLVGCSSDEDKDNNQSQPLAACPDEVDLTTVNLPCDCYGHEANSTSIVDPSCKTQVVCCPAIGNLRCEDHEYCDDAGNCYVEAGAEAAVEDAAPEAATEDAAPADAAEDVVVAKCPYEKDLSKVTLPCKCGDTIVEDVATAMPDCTKTVVCCPATGGLKCE